MSHLSVNRFTDYEGKGQTRTGSTLLDGIETENLFPTSCIHFFAYRNGFGCWRWTSFHQEKDAFSLLVMSIELNKKSPDRQQTRNFSRNNVSVLGRSYQSSQT